MSLTVTLSRIEKMLNAFIYVSRKAVRAKDTSDRYVKVITDGLAEERDEALEAAAHLVEAYPTYPQHNARLAAAIRAMKGSGWSARLVSKKEG